MVGTLYWTQ